MNARKTLEIYHTPACRAVAAEEHKLRNHAQGHPSEDDRFSL